MRAALLLSLALVACGPKAPDYPLDAELTLSDVQLLGTHNSYHLAPEEFLVEDLDYSHAPLTTQLADYGVRQFELDVNRVDPTDPIEVFHIFFVDEGTTCRLFTDCLGQMKAWSDLNPAHVTLIVMLEPKNPFDAGLADSLWTQLEEEVLSVWPRDRVIAPADVQGAAATLSEAVTTTGWPALGDGRGKILFALLDGGEHRDSYTHGESDLDGRLFFADSDPGAPYAAFMLMDDPVTRAVDIGDAARAGYLVRSRADSPGSGAAQANDTTRADAAIASGAHFISTDHPAPVEGIDYVVEIPGGEIGRCNPISAPADCTAADIELPYTLRE